ncbi:hypothetical protein V6N11_013259 [Hibiscus sabdariffa]|uniref:Uncharacterized protein n=2 Tax=Hibiscus sabdariffa TaxID=183260 RepID=A0ABR2G725_9ROSI
MIMVTICWTNEAATALNGDEPFPLKPIRVWSRFTKALSTTQQFLIFGAIDLSLIPHESTLTPLALTITYVPTLILCLFEYPYMVLHFTDVAISTRKYLVSFSGTAQKATVVLAVPWSSLEASSSEETHEGMLVQSEARRDMEDGEKPDCPLTRSPPPPPFKLPLLNAYYA